MRLYPMSNSSVQTYLNEISKYPLLTATQEIELSRQVQDAAKLQEESSQPLTAEQQRVVKRGAHAKQKLMKSNLRLVVHIAKQYTRRLTGSGLEFLDLIQEGALGLNRAAEMFDSTRGYKFSTYAYWWVRQAITRAIDSKETVIRVPQYAIDKLNKATKFATKYTQETGKRPSMQLMAEHAELDVDELQLLMQRALVHTSLDCLVHGDGSPIGDLIPDVNALDGQVEILREDERERLLSVGLGYLDETELMLTKRRYGLEGNEPETLAALAKDMKLSRERVRQKLVRALSKMRRYIHVT